MKFVQYFFLVSLTFVLFSCGDDMPDVTEGEVAPGFKLEGKWYFKTVSGEGIISGVATKDDDPNPTGFIIFNDDGTGYSEFSINLLDRPYGKTENFTWERTSERVMTLTQSDGDVDIWNIVRANENVIEAGWDIFFSDQFNATITSVLTPNP